VCPVLAIITIILLDQFKPWIRSQPLLSLTGAGAMCAMCPPSVVGVGKTEGGVGSQDGRIAPRILNRV
jgi:hypothetical protein